MKAAAPVLLPAVLVCLLLLAAGCTGPAGSPYNTSRTPAVPVMQETSPVQPAGGQDTDPDIVPVEIAYSQAVSTHWSFISGGPYDSDPNWTQATLDPDPAIEYDIQGKPLYYEFIARRDTVTTAQYEVCANKIMGCTVSRIYVSGFFMDYTGQAREAERNVTLRYPGQPVLSTKFVSYYRGQRAILVTLLNTTSSGEDRAIVDPYSLQIIRFTTNGTPEDLTGIYYLGRIPESERQEKRSSWEGQNANLTGVIHYARSQGIDPAKPLDKNNSLSIRDYLESGFRNDSAGGSKTPTSQMTVRQPEEDLVIGDDTISRNIVPVETARDHAQAYFWKRLVDRPDIYESLTYRNATLRSTDPVVIEDIHGRKLFYLFSVERAGNHIDWIVTTANNLLGSYLAMPADEYQFDNATRKAQVIAGKEFGNDPVVSTQSVYCNDPSRYGVWVILTTRNPSTGTKHRVVADAWTLNVTVEEVSLSGDDTLYPSLFSRVTSKEARYSIEQWNGEYKSDREFLSFAASQGIRGDRVLSDAEIITLGTWLFNGTRKTPGEFYDPINPGPTPYPTLNEEARAWHERADWVGSVFVDAGMNDSEVRRILSDHAIPYNYTLKSYVFPSMGGDYFLNVREQDYSRALSLMKADGSARILPREGSMGEFLQAVKRVNGAILVPVAVSQPEEADAKRLIASGVPLKRMKEVHLEFTDTVYPDKMERGNILKDLDSDGRILFTMKEYLEGT
ncbi:MAG: hypothetical protein ABFC24_04165 [Methanoregulaceae archaeon]